MSFNRRHSAFGCTVALALLVSCGGGETTQAPEATIEELLEVIRSRAIAEQTFVQMTASLEADLGDLLSDDYWDRFRAEVDYDELLALTAMVYERHYTQQMVNELTAFYRSPAGQRVLDVQAVVTSESIAAGMEWGQALSRKVTEDVAAQEPEVPALIAAPPPPPQD